MRDLPCIYCGLCCTQVTRLVDDPRAEGKIKDRGDGVCVNLDPKTNKCNIYETRPPLCYIEKQKPHFLGMDEWFDMSHQACLIVLGYSENDWKSAIRKVEDREKRTKE